MAHGITIRDTDHLRDQPGRETEVVSAEHVDRFLSAAPFFDGLVDAPETHEQDQDGTITVTQRTPDGDTRVTTFTPIDESPDTMRWGACGVLNCTDCLPAFDVNNNPIEGH